MTVRLTLRMPEKLVILNKVKDLAPLSVGFFADAQNDSPVSAQNAIEVSHPEQSEGACPFVGRILR